MIDWTAFIDSLDLDSFEEISDAVNARKVDEAETLAQDVVLSFSEVELARENPFEAIRTVRNRLRCSVLVAKAAVEMVAEADEEQQAAWEADQHREDGGDAFAHGDAADDFQETIIGMDQPFVD